MSKKTKEYLEVEKRAVEERVRQLGGESSGHQRASLHDDAASENALNLARAKILQIGELKGVNIISPREDNSSVDIGNTVTVDYGDGDTETYTLLGSDDAKWGVVSGAISTNSPLGRAIRGKSQGDTTRFETPDGRKIDVKIDKIDKGEF